MQIAMSLTSNRSSRELLHSLTKPDSRKYSSDASSTGTVRHRTMKRRFSYSSGEHEKLPLTVRNRNKSDTNPTDAARDIRRHGSAYERVTQLNEADPFLGPDWKAVRKAKSTAALNDPNITTAVQDSIRLGRQQLPIVPDEVDVVESCNENQRPKNPLQRWVKTLHRRNAKKSKQVTTRQERWYLDEFDSIPSTSYSGQDSSTGHKKSSSWASSGFVTAMKSATASFTTMSVAAASKPQSLLITRGSDRGSLKTPSLDYSLSGAPSIGQRIVDEASLERAYKRRNIIHEIIKTEEGYVRDLKLLIDYYRTISQRVNIDTIKIVKNINDILELHETILHSIRPVLSYWRVLPGQHSLLQLRNHQANLRPRSQGIDRAFKQLDRPRRAASRSSIEIARKREVPEDRVMSEPEDAADVARAFNDLIGRFFVYEEYGSRFASMMNQLTLSEKYHDVDAYEKGFEALANTVAPCSTKEANRRQSLTYRDLLMKPIQRITKYPLLFGDLLGQTPVIDCPESCSEVEKTLYRLRETVDEINKATNDEYAHEKIQRSWKLQDLLKFPDPMHIPYTMRSLGHARLCGVLHAAYQTPNGVYGEYVLCALFKSCMILASRPKFSHTRLPFQIVASISLANLEIDDCDDGRGLQCYNALYSWKIVFEADQYLFEIILSGCSKREEAGWKTMTKYLADRETRIVYEDNPRAPEQYSRLFFQPQIQPLGEAFGQPGTLARQLSTRRPATVGPRTALNQVVIKSTHSLKGHLRSTSELSVGRSQTTNPGHRLQTLVPRRMDRIQMEQDMADVWTKEDLPYPGMGSQIQIRASANTVMRRLSRATTGSFGKRSASHCSNVSGNLVHSLVEGIDPFARSLDARFGLNPLIESPGGSTPDAFQHPPGSLTSSGTFSKDSSDSKQNEDASSGDAATHLTEAAKPRLRKKFASSLSLFRTMSIDGMKAMFNQGSRKDPAQTNASSTST